MARALGPLLGDTARRRVAVQRERDRGKPIPLAFETPHTPFNRALPTSRSFATSSLPLDRVQALRRTHGVSVNDVVLALVAGAARRYLEHTGLPVRGPLLATVPIGLDEAHDHGNQLSSLITSLCTDIPDPLVRLRAIHRVTASAKEGADLRDPQSMKQWAEYTPGRLFSGALRLYSKLRLANAHRAPVNLVVSNVRGPDNTLFVSGAKLTRLWSVGPILHGIGLNVTCWSYAGELGVAALSHGELPIPLWVLNQGLMLSLEELEQATAKSYAARDGLRRPHISTAQ